VAFADIGLFKNQLAFNLDQSRLDARGGLKSDGGMINPVDARINPGARLVRYCIAEYPPKGPGRWWLLEEHYNLIDQQARAYGVPTASLVREHCCVSTDWPGMTWRIVCEVTAPLRCYKGTSNRAFRGGKVHYDGKMGAELGVIQLYIPGLDDAALFRSAMKVISENYVPIQESRALEFPAP
jgi:hypothetical protein